MGLDITVDVKVAGVCSNRTSDELSLFQSARAECGLGMDDYIHVRPGSYSGVHRLRMAYARMKGVDVGESMTDWQNSSILPESHLVQHSDCDGWYLPDDFLTPILENGISVGSSVRLLAEIMEIPRDSLLDLERHAWNCLFVAAFASVATYTPIKFH